MKKRLQVLLDEREWSDLRKFATSRGQTVAECVRQTLRQVVRSKQDDQIQARLAAIRAAAALQFPSGTIDQMNADITRGYSTGLPTSSESQNSRGLSQRRP